MLDLKKIREEIEEFGFRNDLTRNEVSHIIFLAFSLIGEVQTRQDIIDRIKDYCKLHNKESENNIFLKDIENLTEGNILWR